MAEVFQTLLVLLGLVVARVADPGEFACANDCPAVPVRPVVAWSAQQDVRADEVRLFSRGARRPGQPGPEFAATCPSIAVEGAPARFVVIGPARERLASALAPRAQVVVRMQRVGPAR